MSHSRVWDLVVVGGGTGGLVASRTAASFGSRVLLIEADRLGGDCLWTGCVPSKALIAAAAAAKAARGNAVLGVTTQGATVDFPAVMRHVRNAMTTIAPIDSPEALERDGVDVKHGRATFTGANSLRVAGQEVRFRQAVIATGSAPAPLEVPGSEQIELLNNETFWDLEELPARLLVVGGGAIGCEIAQAMARLGSEVTLVHRGERLLPKETEAAAGVIQESLEQDGVRVLLGREVTALSASGDGRRAGTATLNDQTEHPFDAALVAIGRRASGAGLGAKAAGVEVDRRGFIRVTSALRTSNPHIWAVGDVTGLPQFTHVAGVNGSIAATNAVLGIKRTIDRDAVPRVTFTSPEVGAVGVSPNRAESLGFTVVTVHHDDNDRAVAEAETAGFTQLVVDGRGRIRGGVVVGPRAGETVGEIGLAVRNKLTTGDLASTTHAYPTYSDSAWNAAVVDVRVRLGKGVIGSVVTLLHAVRQRRVR